MILQSCEDNSENGIEVPDLFEVGSFTDNGTTVVVYTPHPPQVGYNVLYLQVHEGGEALDNLDIDIMPVMHMETHSHSSPVELPGQVREEEYNLYRFAVVFTMPGSGMHGGWELNISISDDNQPDTRAEGVIETGVEESRRVINFETENGDRYVLSLVEPEEPETGSNELLLTLHKRESMMSYPPVLDAEFLFEPWMPSMDHGSGNNIHPVHQQNGHYKGLVNFNMTGDWELRFEITRNEIDLGQHIFEVQF